MSLSSDGTVMTMPVAPTNMGGNGFGGFGGDGAWWIIILFLFVFCGWGNNGWGGNGGGMNGGVGPDAAAQQYGYAGSELLLRDPTGD